MDIKIEAKTVVANEGGFEPHPEGYTPRVFAAVMEGYSKGEPTETDPPKVYEILSNGQAIPWPCLPILEGFDYWVLYVEHLADVGMYRASKKAGFGPSTQKAIDAAQAAHRQYQQDPVPQADGYSGTLPEDVTWIGEIDGKRYSGLGKPESGPLSHLPEGSH